MLPDKKFVPQGKKFSVNKISYIDKKLGFRKQYIKTIKNICKGWYR